MGKIGVLNLLKNAGRQKRRLKREMRAKCKKAFEPYYKGQKTFSECQSDALVALLGEPFEKV